jgi:voltage-gated potassium channel
MTDHDPAPGPNRASLVDRQVKRISNARSVTVGLAISFVALGFIGAIVMRLADPDNFPSLGLAIWWAIQTVTTVGYGDHVPTTTTGRVVGGVEMVLGVSFIAFLTAGVTSTVIHRADAKALEDDRARTDRHTQTIVAALTDTRTAIGDLDSRLDRIESKLT